MRYRGEQAERMTANNEQTAARRGWIYRALDWVERVGNRLPDPAMLFLILMLVVWAASWWLSGWSFREIDPRTGNPIAIRNLLQGASFTAFMADMVRTFVNFPPVGIVLVAMLGLGVAEHTGFIAASLRAMLSVTPRKLLTPALMVVGVVSHIAIDAGYVLVIPLGAVIFHAAGRHPLAGIAAAFTGVSGGFSATFFLPSSLDPLLSGLTQTAAHLIDPSVVVNPLNNYFFTTVSSLLVIGVGWYVTDRVIEPRLAGTKVDGDVSRIPGMDALAPEEKRGLRWAVLSMLLAVALLIASAWPADSPWRAPGGELAVTQAPLMQSIVSLIFVIFVIPGVVYGCAAGTVKTHRDIVAGMSKAMSGMGYYLVMAFFAAQFLYAFAQSNLGALMAIKGAAWLQSMGLPMAITVVGIVLLSAFVNLLVGSASAKWALIGAIMVPMLMELGVSPDLTQAAYRVGDSSTNIVTPLLPYFPLIVVFCQRYVTSTGIGTLLALMLPYSVALLTGWTLLLLGFWALGIPLGLDASYRYP